MSGRNQKASRNMVVEVEPKQDDSTRSRDLPMTEICILSLIYVNILAFNLLPINMGLQNRKLPNKLLSSTPERYSLSQPQAFGLELCYQLKRKKK